MFKGGFILPEKPEDWAYGVALVKSRKSPDKRLRMAMDAISYVKSREIVLAELLFDTSSGVDVDRRDVGRLFHRIEKYPIQYFIVFSPDDITEDLDDLIEFAFLLKKHGAKIVSIEDDEIITYEALVDIKKEIENGMEADANEEV